MSESSALYHCVCGTDVPISVDARTECSARVSCPMCNRQNVLAAPDSHRAAETVVFTGVKVDELKEARASSTPGSAWQTAATVGGPPSSRPNLAGRVIDHFEVLEELGRGGMGTVYRALDRSLERYVALKILDSEEARNQCDLMQAFTHEARTQARMNHPGITTIYYIGRFEEMTYFAMEIVSGSNLESRLRAGPLPFREVIEAGLQVVQALKEAKERGVIHRDIKPGNLILSSSGRIKVTDFGLSKTEKGGLQITGSRQITGTPFYIAPEQARSEATDFRSDIYSLGATLYHLAYGRPPFEGDNFMAVISRHLTEPVHFPASPPPDVPPGFPYLLKRMLAKKPQDRFQSYEELELALRELRPEARVLAAFGHRAVASFLDHGIIFVLGMAFSSIWFVTSLNLGKGGQATPMAISVAALGYVLYQTLSGSTLGKLFGKLRVARIDGQPLRRSQLALRGCLQYLNPISWSLPQLAEASGHAWPDWLLSPYFLGMLLFSIVDVLWALTNRNRRTIHDLILKTWVLDRV